MLFHRLIQLAEPEGIAVILGVLRGLRGRLEQLQGPLFWGPTQQRNLRGEPPQVVAGVELPQRLPGLVVSPAGGQKLHRLPNHCRPSLPQVDRLLVFGDGGVHVALQLIQLPLEQQRARPTGPALDDLGEESVGVLQARLIALLGLKKQQRDFTGSPPYAVRPLDAADVVHHSLERLHVVVQTFLAPGLEAPSKGLHRQVEQSQPDFQIILGSVPRLAAREDGPFEIPDPNVSLCQPGEQALLIGRVERIGLFLQTAKSLDGLLVGEGGEPGRAGQAEIGRIAHLGFRTVQNRLRRLRWLPVFSPLSEVGQVGLHESVAHLFRLVGDGVVQPFPGVLEMSLGRQEVDLGQAEIHRLANVRIRLVEQGVRLGPVALVGRRTQVADDQQTNGRQTRL